MVLPGVQGLISAEELRSCPPGSTVLLRVHISFPFYNSQEFKIIYQSSNNSLKTEHQMAQRCLYTYTGKVVCLHGDCLAQFKDDGRQNSFKVKANLGRPPAEEFAPLASVFRRRLLTGVGTASLVALGANFAGITSFLLGFSPETGRNLKLDVLYPVGGYSRCIDTNEGFEFIYPSSWVKDQTVFFRAVGKAESKRSLDPPPLNESANRRRQNLNEPIVAFGPPGSNGELNISVIVSAVPLDFKIEAFGSPKDIGEAVVRTITGAGKRPDVKANLIDASVREDTDKSLNYYKLEFGVESPTFRRHNVAICCARGGRLYTLNAQSPESAWRSVKQNFSSTADSFILTS